MSFGQFLSDRLPTVVLTALAAGFAFVMLLTLGIGTYAGGYLAQFIYSAAYRMSMFSGMTRAAMM